ncbi:hypothetical protein C447_00880 [Halococcus hamelinensis 100A6]|uniref:Uncharacterized protein n=2 Tax=Halococcus hamelinensis TaxID=332168 RepID=M0MCI2_9EURY|nr:hypothetical protein C447_00880 [Halococcus hamelinensis 100A6]
MKYLSLMEDGKVRLLQYLGTALVVVSVAVHLWWGLPRFLIYARPQTLAFYLQSGGVPDPRPFLFMGMVVAIVIVGMAVWRGLVEDRTVYAVLLILMLGSIVGWMLWHTILNHGVALTSSNAAATEGHQGSVVSTLFTHFVTVPLEGGTKLVELAAVLVFGVLLRVTPRTTKTDR